MRPLADEIRPQTLDDVAGQKHLLGEGALLRRLIENGTDANLIFMALPVPARPLWPTLLPNRRKRRCIPLTPPPHPSRM